MSNKIPRDSAAEGAVIGSIILRPEYFGEISKIVSTDDFYSRANREIWNAIRQCVADGQLDLVTLNAQLNKQHAEEHGATIAMVVDMCNTVVYVDISAVKRYAEIVADCGDRRRKMSGLSTAMSQLSDLSKDISAADEFVQNVVLAPSGKSHTKTFGEAFDEYHTDYERRKSLGGALPGILSGFSDLDLMLGGFEGGRMYVLGGRPSMGKTAFALNLAVGMALMQKNVLYFSLEMGTVELTQRINGIISGVVIRKMQTCRLDDAESEKIAAAKTKLADRLMINEDSYQTPESILTECVSQNITLAAKGEKLDAVIIDHLQLLSSSGRFKERRSQIGEASRMCKISAKQLGCPFIVLSQLSRAMRDRKDQTPRLTDLRESGDIEQDADTVMLIHRDEVEDKNSIETKGSAKIIIAKNRSGETGTLKYDWFPKKNKFAEYTDPNVAVV